VKNKRTGLETVPPREEGLNSGEQRGDGKSAGREPKEETGPGSNGAKKQKEGNENSFLLRVAKPY